jgi:hypothetical protein
MVLQKFSDHNMGKKFRLLWNPCIHYRVVEIPQLHSSLQIVPYLVKIHFYIILPCMHRHLSWSLTLRFPINFGNSYVIKGKNREKCYVFYHEEELKIYFMKS